MEWNATVIFVGFLVVSTGIIGYAIVAGNRIMRQQNQHNSACQKSLRSYLESVNRQ